MGGDKTDLQSVRQDDTIEVNQDRSKAQAANDPEVQKILDRYPVIKGDHSFADDIKATNQKYSESKKNKNTYYTHNCQRCVNAYEARRRGYDVTAAAKYSASDPLAYMANEKGWANVYVGGKESLIKCFSDSTGGVREKVIQQVLSWGDGARGIVRVQWKGGVGGHVFIAECHNGGVSFLDPQCADLDVSKYFDRVNVIKTYVLRTDNKEFSTLIEQCCDYKLSQEGGIK